MGAAGKKYLRIAHSKSNSPAPQAKDNGYGTPPHPLRVVSGQQFWPRHGDQRRSFVVGRVQARNSLVWGRFLDQDEGKIRVSEQKLLATREDGHGLYFAFAGYMPRRYSTWAQLASIDETTNTAVLVLPEWHPSRPVAIPAHLLPVNTPGAWLSCRADLSAGRAAYLNVADFKIIPDPGPARCHRPAYVAPAPAAARVVPPWGRECGDIVLECSNGIGIYNQVGGKLEVHVRERPTGIAAGGRIYLAGGERLLREYLFIEVVRPCPNGLFLICDPKPRTTGSPIPMPDDERITHRWRWRWWAQDLDNAPDTPEQAFAAHPYDRSEHLGEYVIKSRPLPVG